MAMPLIAVPLPSLPEIAHRDRQRLDVALVDVDLDTRGPKRGGSQAGGERAGDQDRPEDTLIYTSSRMEDRGSEHLGVENSR